VLAMAAALVTFAASNAGAQTEPYVYGSQTTYYEPHTELSLMGGMQILNQNDTALPEDFTNIPAVATLSYRMAPNWALDGEFTWLIPIEQTGEDLKTPDILAYQANVRGILPMNGGLEPYLAAGAGGMTFLGSTDDNRIPQVEDSQTMLALNFGGGLSYPFAGNWALKGDFREFVAFPENNAVGLSNETGADEIWMERIAVGLGVRF
jgi:opacity protein-like surface antigen